MILASVITYELSKRLGREAATKLFHTEANTTLESDQPPCVPAINVVRKLRRLTEVAVLHDAGGSSIGFARSRAFSVALASGADRWVSIDDDIDASPETIRHMVTAVDPQTPQIVIVPYLMRTTAEDTVAATLDPESSVARVTTGGARLRRGLFGGMGLVCVSRAALVELADLWNDLRFVDDDGVERYGLFCEYIRNDWWAREDYAFFSRVPSHVRVEVLLTGLTDHGGKRLRLENVEKLPGIPVPAGYSRRDTEPPPALVV